MLIQTRYHRWGNGDKDVILAAIFYNSFPLEQIEGLMDDRFAGALATFVVALLHS